jgi:glycosyltransferase involved in cell wall biosynthesis
VTAAPAVPLVLHVIPSAVTRGAQREARALADRLDVPGRRHHRLLSLSGPGAVPVDLALGRPRADGEVAGFHPGVALELRSLLGRQGPALAVAHGGDPLKYLVAATVGRRLPVAYYATGTFGAAGRPWRVRLWRTLVGRAAVVACEGAEVLDECASLLGVPGSRLVLAPNGRDPDVFRPAGEPTPEAAVPTVAFVGALNEGKGPERFVAAVAELRRRGFGLRAVACGDGPQHRELLAPAAAAGVELLGAVDDVASVLRGADVLVFPSRPTGEGMPGVLIEAGMSAVPVVATRVPGASTVVEDGVTGILVPVDDHDALVEATAGLLARPDRRRLMGTAARSRCVEHFGLDAVVAVWASFIGPLVDAAVGGA